MKVSKMGNRARVFLLRLVKQPDFYFCLLFTILNVVMTKFILQTNGVNHFVVISLVELVIEALFIYVVVKGRRKRWPVQKRFLVFAIPLGIMFILLLPPGQSPDELNHFRRAYGIASGSIMADKMEDGGGGSELPNGIDSSLASAPQHGMYDMVGDKLSKEVSKETSVQEYKNTARKKK